MAHDIQSGRSASGQEWVTLTEATIRLGVPADTIRQWIALGRLQTREPAHDGGDLLVMLKRNTPLQSSMGDHHVLSGPDLVGRGQELETLVQELESTARGNGSLMIVGGEAGIGKTTLVNALIPHTKALGFAVLTGHCFDVEHTPPYGPWIEMFRGLTTTPEQPGPPAEFLEPDGLQSASSPTVLYDGVEQFLVESSRGRPLLVVLEDQHWADQASLDLLRYVARRLRAEPVMLLITYRDVELSADQPLFRVLPHLVREANALRMTLRRLDRDAVEDIVRNRYALDGASEGRLSEYLWKYAEGNPFFTEELANNLEDEGTLCHVSGHWEIGELPEFRVPPIVRQVIENRLWHLSQAARDMLRMAAAIGVEVPVELWQTAAGVSEAELSDCIDQALTGQLIEEIPERSSVRFRHALIQEALYDGLTILNRRSRHQRIAEILAAKPQADPELVANHFNQARDFRAVDWLLRAGRRAALAFAYNEATVRFEQARELLEHRPDSYSDLAWLLCELAVAQRYMDPRQALRYVESAWELASSIDDVALLAVILRTRSHLRGFLGEDGLPELYEAVELYESLTDDERERIGKTALAYTVNRGVLAQRIAYYARNEEARALGERFVQQANPPMTARQHNELGVTYLGLGLAYANLGQPEAASGAFSLSRDQLLLVSNHLLLGQTYVHEYRHVISVYYPERVEARRSLIENADLHLQQSIFTQAPDFQSHERIYSALILEGRWEEARTSARALVNSQYKKVQCAAVLAELDWLQGAYNSAWSWITLAMPAGSSAEPASVHFHDVLATQSIAAQVALASGQPDVARSWIKANARWRAWGDSVLGHFAPDYLRAQHRRALGNMDLALEHARKTVALALEPRQPLDLLRAERLLGEIATQMELFDEAERHLGVALDLSTTIQGIYETALTEIAYAGLLIATHKATDAQPLLQHARTTLESLCATPALQRLAEIESLLAKPGQSSEAVAGLSPRELEVLQLVAQGLTDAEIGERLFISRRTVSGHLQSIFNKCGVSSRAAATAFAYEHGIVAVRG